MIEIQQFHNSFPTLGAVKMYRQAMAIVVALVVLGVVFDSVMGGPIFVTEDMMPAGLDQQGYM